MLQVYLCNIQQILSTRMIIGFTPERRTKKAWVVQLCENSDNPQMFGRRLPTLPDAKIQSMIFWGNH